MCIHMCVLSSHFSGSVYTFAIGVMFISLGVAQEQGQHRSLFPLVIVFNLNLPPAVHISFLSRDRVQHSPSLVNDGIHQVCVSLLKRKT